MRFTPAPLVIAALSLFAFGCGETDSTTDPVDVPAGNNGKGDTVNNSEGPINLAQGLAECEIAYDALVAEAEGQQAFTIAAIDYATCAHELTDSKVPVIEAILEDDLSDLAGSAQQTLDAYRSAMNRLCEQVVISSETPDGSLSQTARAHCNARTHVFTGELVGNWVMLEEDPIVDRIEARELYPECYATFDADSEAAASTQAMIFAQQDLGECMTAQMEAYRAERLSMAIENAFESDPEQVTAEFNDALDAVSAASLDFCVLLVATSENSEGSIATIFANQCSNDMLIMTDRLFR